MEKYKFYECTEKILKLQPNPKHRFDIFRKVTSNVIALVFSDWKKLGKYFPEFSVLVSKGASIIANCISSWVADRD